MTFYAAYNTKSLSIQVKQEKHTKMRVIMFLHDKSNLLEMKNTLTFQLRLFSAGRLRVWTGASKSRAHSNTPDRNTGIPDSLFDRADTQLCLYTCKWTHG